MGCCSLMAPPSWWVALDSLVRLAAPRVLPALDPRDDTLAYWLTSPAQAGADLIGWTSLLAVVFWVFFREDSARLWRVAVQPALPASGFLHTVLAVADVTLRGSVWATAASTLYIKIVTNRAIFLLQPCHISNALLCVLTLVDARGPWGVWAARALWVDLLAKYGTAAALIVPDVGPSPIWGETFSFFFQHWVLCLLPAVWLLRQRFALFTGARAVLFAWACISALHFCLLLPVTLLFGMNVNYMAAPPPGVFPRNILPIEYYRSCIAVAGIGMAAGMRFLVVAPLATVGEVIAAYSDSAEKLPAKVAHPHLEATAVYEMSKARVALPVLSSRRRRPTALASA